MKLGQSIYDGVEFHETPYNKTDKFSVHVPKKTFGFSTSLNGNNLNNETAISDLVKDSHHPIESSVVVSTLP